MKLTVISANNVKQVIELNKDLTFDVSKGEQFIFSNGFTSYVLNLKDNQQSIELLFNVNGKDIKVYLKGIVPFIQENPLDPQNSTNVVINKSINDKDIDNIIGEGDFNGSEIIDRLEALISSPVDLGNADKLTLISDFQTLIESLGAAAAGGQQAGANAGNTTSNGSTFNSIFSPINDNLSGIAETDKWVNLSESISSIPIDTGNDINVPTVSISDATINENEGFISFVITLSAPSDEVVTVVLRTQDGTAKEISDYIASFGTLVFLPGETILTFDVPVVNDSIYEVSKNLFLNIEEITNATIADGQGEGTILDTDIPTVSITGSEVVEGEYAIFNIKLTGKSFEDIVLTLQTKNGTATENDYTPITEVLIEGKWIPSSTVTIPAGQESIQIRVKTNDDVLKEPVETFFLEAAIISGTTTNKNASGTSFIADEVKPYVPNEPDTKDNVNVNLIAVDTDVTEGETATYKVTLTDDNNNPVVAVEDMEVTFTYTYKTASGSDIIETTTVTIKAGTSEVPVNVKTIDDNFAEGSEEFIISIKDVSNQTQFENVTVNKSSVETTINDETAPTNPDAQTALVSISGPASVIEGDTTTPYTVSITQAPTTDLTVSFTYSGVAVNGTDFTGVASVVIKAGTTSSTFTIATLDDNLAEGAEKFKISIDSSKLGKVGGLEDVRVSTVNNSVETTINDETAPTNPDAQTALVSISGPASVIEGDTTTPYTVSISQAPTTDLTVSFTYSGVAVNGTDFTGVASVVIKAGTTSSTFTIATLDDNLAEGAEKFTVAINPSSLGKVGGLEDVRVSTVNNSVETTINDETAPTNPDAQTALVSISGPASVIEGDTTTPYTVSISQAPTTDLTVSFTYSGVAVNGTDFTGVASVVIKAGTTSSTFKIATLDDNLAEGAEKFTVAINPSSLGKVGGLEDVRVSTVNNSVETTINDETAPTNPDAQTALVSISGPASVIEGDTTTPYTVSISQAPTTDLTVSFTYSGVAVNGTDFTGVASVVIKAGTTSSTFKIATLDDNLAEGAEKFTVAINPSSLGKVGGLEDVRVSTVNNSVETTINDETAPTNPDAQTALVSISGPASVIEGDTTTPYTVSISQAPTTDLTVSFTYSGVAVNGTDFTGVASVVIKAGTTSSTFKIATLDDNLAEGAEKFKISIDSSKLGKVGGLEDVRVSTVNNSVETTINDETAPINPDAQTALVSISGPASVIEGDTTTPYTVSISQAPTTDLTVSFTYSGVAVNGTDFTGVASVVIKAGTTSSTFTIATLDDNLAEGAEKFKISIDSSKLGKVGGLEDVRVDSVKSSVETTINDETAPTNPDAQTALVSIEGPASVVEGQTTADYTVKITQAPTTDLTVSFTYSGVAVNGTDFTGVASVVIKAGTTSSTFTIATLDDNLAEGAEKFTVAINPSSLGKVGGLEDVRVSTVNNSVETTINDETAPTNPDAQTALVSISGPASVIEGDTTTPYTVSISQAPTTDLTVSFTYSGVAVNGTDFTGVASVVIKAGTTSSTFTIATLDDNLAEGAEKFTVAINPSSLGKVGGLEDVRVSTVNNSVETTINDETAPTNPDAQTALVSISGPASVIEGDTTTPYTVSISQAPTTDLTVSFTYSGVAVNGTDFTGVASVVIKAGTTSSTFKIATLDDNLAEGAEKFTVAINPSSLGKVGGLEDVRVDSVKSSVETTINDNDRFSINIKTALVDEDALVGTADADSYDPDVKEVTGSIGLNTNLLVDLQFTGGQITTLTSKGEKIVLNYSSNNEVIKGITTSGREVFEISLNETSRSYTFKLKDVVDHPDFTSEDLISSLNLRVMATTEKGHITAGYINISIADDVPTANCIIIDANSQYKETNTNLVIAIDNSASMGSGVGSKMELAKEAAIKLIEKYEKMGDVNVKIVSFNTEANASQWYTSSTAAKSAILALFASGNTNYEDTLRDTMNTFNTSINPKPQADQDIFYMLSDGDPTDGDANGTDNISGLIPTWKTFAENNFDDVYAIGIGSEINLNGNDRGSLNQIADLTNGHDPFIVANVNNLTDEMLATIVNINGQLVINSGGNELDFSFGADGPADGTGPKLDGNKIAFSWGDADLTNGVGAIINDNDGTGPQLTWLVYNNGKVILAKDVNTGEILIKLEARDILSNNPTYEVTQFKANTGINKLKIPYTVVDGDGDGSTATLTINIDYSKQNTPPEAEDRHFELDCQKDDVYTIGLKSEYYGVNTQISNLTQFKSIVSSNNPDATFTATKIDYGYGIGDVSKGTNLQAFLKNDASSLSNDPADTTDGGIHMYGKVFLTAGTYNFKVYADDGYDILIDGTSVASFENNQSPATKIHNQFIIAQDGYYDIEMFWWDQGGAYVFKPEISFDGGLTYKTLDSTMLFTQIDDSTNNTNKIEFTLEDFVSDIEDDSTSTIVKIKIVSLPEDGILTVNGNPVQIGDIFDEKTNIVYTPNANQEDTLYGTMSDVGTLSEWGTVNNGVLTTDDGKAIIKAYTNGTLGEVGFASENNNHSHDGLGLGVVGSTDNDQIESTANEKIVIEFKEIVTKAEFGLASLGGNFTPGNSADANAHWVAYKDGVKVAEGDVKQSIDDSNPTTNTFKINVEFDKIEFTTTANVNSNYSIQYMNVDYKIDDSFNYISIDSDGFESEKATVTFDIDSKGNIIPKTTNDSIITDEDTSYTIKVEDFGNYSDSSTSSFIKVMIVDLPTNGVLKLNGAVISENTEILKSDIDSGNLVFEPNSQSDVDGSFTFKVSNGTNYSEINTVSIDIKAVADKPTATIEVKEIEIVTGSNLIENGSFEDISGKDANGNVVASDYDISSGGLVTRQEITGWKVVEGKPMEPHDKAHAGVGSTDGDNYMDLGASPGNSTIAQTINGLVEGQVYSLSVDYLDKAAKQGMGLDSGKMEVIWNGKVIATIDGNNTENWETLKIDLTAGSGDKTDTLQFKEIGSNNDNGGIALDNVQLIEIPSDNKEYDVNISAALGADNIDGSEILTVKIDGVPSNATLTSSTYTLTKNADGSWTVEVPNGVKSIDYSNLKMIVPSNIKYVDLTITARATEINDNINGNNYAESKAIDSTIYGIDELEQVNMKAFKYNLVLTIDNSKSMEGDKITLAKAAMINLINKYNGLGEVKVLLNVFNNYGEIKGVWVDASTAKNLINAITTCGGTNYDDALLKNIDILAKNPAPLDGKTISYFVSDGVPTYGMYKSGDTWYRDGDRINVTDINDSIVSQWKNLNIDKTYSIGIGTSELNEYMREISKNPDEDVIVINDANQLAQTLDNTIQELLVEGNVLNNVVGGNGKISIESINFDGVNYRKDNFPQDGLLIGNNKIKFTFDFETGNYKYYAKSSTFVEEKKTFTVNATDSNGDKDSFDVSVNVKVTQGKSENIQTLMGDDIDLSTVITKTVDIISLDNSKIDKLKIDLKDVLDLEDKQLIVKGDLGDKVTLDTQNDWANGGKKELNGVNYKVYTGIGVNSTVKLLIEDDIDISSNI